MSSEIRTRTMAELYLSQGHPGRARSILVELLKDNPGDERLLELLEQARAALIERPDGKGEESSAQAEATATGTAGERRPEGETPPASSPTLRKRAAELGAAVVERLANGAIDRLTDILARVQERRRR
ncbi:MAG: hypothetical protein C4523_20455 [Myxococcales bacterium]|nr:MAG: hypothetical protein C4523_20455 [Myxococcales bacterium]